MCLVRNIMYVSLLFGRTFGLLLGLPSRYYDIVQKLVQRFSIFHIISLRYSKDDHIKRENSKTGSIVRRVAYIIIVYLPSPSKWVHTLSVLLGNS